MSCSTTKLATRPRCQRSRWLPGDESDSGTWSPRGLLDAGQLVRFGESAGLLVPVSNRAMEEAFRQFGRWMAQLPGARTSSRR